MKKKKRTSEHHAASTAWRKRSHFIWIILFNLPQTSAFPSGFQQKLGAVCKCLVPTSLHVKERKSNFTLRTELSDQNVTGCSGIASDDIIASVMTSSLLCVAYQHRETGSNHNNRLVWVSMRPEREGGEIALCKPDRTLPGRHVVSASLWKWEGACLVPDDWWVFATSGKMKMTLLARLATKIPLPSWHHAHCETLKMTRNNAR